MFGSVTVYKAFYRLDNGLSKWKSMSEIEGSIPGTNYLKWRRIGDVVFISGFFAVNSTSRSFELPFTPKTQCFIPITAANQQHLPTRSLRNSESQTENH